MKEFQSTEEIFQKYPGHQSVVGLFGKKSLDYYGPVEAMQMTWFQLVMHPWKADNVLSWRNLGLYHTPSLQEPKVT